jgi:hypothetical protein
VTGFQGHWNKYNPSQGTKKILKNWKNLVVEVSLMKRMFPYFNHFIGFGSVYRVRNKLDGEFYAIKKIVFKKYENLTKQIHIEEVNHLINIRLKA